MARIIVLPEELQEVVDRLDKIEKILKTKQEKIENPFLGSQEFLQLMNISKRTAQTWRDDGIIPFSQIGSKIYYKYSDITKLLDKYCQNSESNLTSH